MYIPCSKVKPFWISDFNISFWNIITEGTTEPTKASVPHLAPSTNPVPTPFVKLLATSFKPTLKLVLAKASNPVTSASFIDCLANNLPNVASPTNLPPIWPPPNMNISPAVLAVLYHKEAGLIVISQSPFSFTSLIGSCSTNSGLISERDFVSLIWYNEFGLSINASPILKPALATLRGVRKSDLPASNVEIIAGCNSDRWESFSCSPKYSWNDFVWSFWRVVRYFR